jgi:hypothetical protein
MKMKQFFYNKSKIQKHIGLGLLIVAFGFILFLRASYAGKFLGVAAVIFVGYHIFQLLRILAVKEPQLIVTAESIDIKLETNINIASKGIVSSEIKVTGRVIQRLLWQNRELHLLYVTEVRGQVFNKRDVVDITYLDISDNELTEILNSNMVES